MKTAKAFYSADTFALMTEMREDSDFWSLPPVMNRLRPQAREDHCWRTSRVQNRKEHHRADLQPKNPPGEYFAAQDDKPCLHLLFVLAHFAFRLFYFCFSHVKLSFSSCHTLARLLFYCSFLLFLLLLSCFLLLYFSCPTFLAFPSCLLLLLSCPILASFLSYLTFARLLSFFPVWSISVWRLRLSFFFFFFFFVLMSAV